MSSLYLVQILWAYFPCFFWCVCHNGHQLFGMGYHFKIFRSQVATGKNFTPCRGVFLPDNTLHEECLWFCFAELIQQDLDFVKIHWNTHYIHQSRHDTVPGKPDELYFLPETLVPQTSCNQCPLKSLTKPE